MYFAFIYIVAGAIIGAEFISLVAGAAIATPEVNTLLLAKARYGLTLIDIEALAMGIPALLIHTICVATERLLLKARLALAVI